MVHTREKVRRIHTINMNWPEHELSEYTHDVIQLGSNAVHALSCDQSLFMIDHVRTVNSGTMNCNRIDDNKHHQRLVIIDKRTTTTIELTIDAPDRRRR